MGAGLPLSRPPPTWQVRSLHLTLLRLRFRSSGQLSLNTPYRLSGIGKPSAERLPIERQRGFAVALHTATAFVKFSERGHGCRMPRVGRQAVPARNLRPLLLAARALRLKASQGKLGGTMALLRGGAIEALRLRIVRRDSEPAPQTHAKVVLPIRIALGGAAAEKIDRFC